jgi:hypothetical protein
LLFVAYFKANQRLEDLCLSNLRGLRSNNWLKFMEVLAHNKSIRSLDISANNIVDC